MMRGHPAAVRNTGHVTYQLAPTGNSQWEKVGKRFGVLPTIKDTWIAVVWAAYRDYLERDCDKLSFIWSIHVKIN